MIFAGEPLAISTVTLPMSACVGCMVVLPSSLRVSAIGAQTVKWSAAMNGVSKDLEDAVINADYSMTLVNVERTDTGTYLATGSNNQGVVNGAHVELMVLERPGEYV